MKRNLFCNNCGKTGHLYHNCNKSIISLGLIVYRKMLNTPQFLMICRKDSLGYVDFIRGKYPVYNTKYIQNIIDEMTNEEKHKIMTLSFDELWNDLWGGFNGNNYRNEERKSKEKFNILKNGIIDNKKDFIKLDDFISNSKTNWDCPEWGFPKGRRNYLETDLTCALREFEEETGYKKSNINVLKNILAYEECFTGSNLKSYKHKYYLGYIDQNKYDNTKYQKSEVSDMKWLSLEECLKHIRPYNYKRIEIINNINKIIQTYSLIS